MKMPSSGKAKLARFSRLKTSDDAVPRCAAEGELVRQRKAGGVEPLRRVARAALVRVADLIGPLRRTRADVRAIDAFARHALRENLPMTIVNHPTGMHAFDLEEDSEASRQIIGQMLAFLRTSLAPVERSDRGDRGRSA